MSKETDQVADEFYELLTKTRKLKLDDEYVGYILFCITGNVLLRYLGLKKFNELVKEVKEKAHD